MEYWSNNACKLFRADAVLPKRKKSNACPMFPFKVLLVGYAPFMEEKQQDLFAKIKRGEWRFHRQDWKHISEDAKDLIRALLVIDPVERMTVDEALRCPWITQNGDDLSSNELHGSLSAIRSKRQTLRSVAKSIIFMGKVGANLTSIRNATCPISEDENEDEVNGQ